MHWRGLAAVGVIVLLAGCSAPMLDGSETSDLERPPGIADDGSVNASELARATFGGMNDSVVRVDHRNGNDSSVVILGPDASVDRGPDGTTWSRANRSVSNSTWDDADYSLDYQRDGVVPPRADGPLRFALAVRLGSGSFEHVGTETVDGQRFHEIELVRPNGLGAVTEHYEVAALVDADGRLRRMTGEVGDSEANATAFRFAFDWSVESVPTPSWAESIPRLAANKAATDQSLVVTHRTGPSIPAGETFSIYHNGSQAEFTLEESLDPGESLHVGLNGTGYDADAVVRRASLRGDGLNSLAGGRTSLDGTVTLADGMTVSIAIDVGRLSV